MAMQGYAEWIGKQAKQALVEEALTTPKPGLVDAFSNGAHKDMDLHMFLCSAKALEPYFVRMAQLGMKYREVPKRLFSMIRQVGLEAENAMYEATGGVNTHKGAVFTMGILSAAAGACAAAEGRIAIDSWIVMEQAMVREILLEELEEMQSGTADEAVIENVQDKAHKKAHEKTHGEQNLVRYGSLGVRGEAALGYPSVMELALPVLKAGRAAGHEWNLVKLQALFTLMSQVEDGNVLSRAGEEGLKEVQRIAGEFLDDGGAYQPDAVERLEKLDLAFIRKHYSNGGCADLLAAAIFMEAVEEKQICWKEDLLQEGNWSN